MANIFLILNELFSYSSNLGKVWALQVFSNNVLPNPLIPTAVFPIFIYQNALFPEYGPNPARLVFLAKPSRPYHMGQGLGLDFQA